MLEKFRKIHLQNDESKNIMIFHLSIANKETVFMSKHESIFC